MTHLPDLLTRVAAEPAVARALDAAHAGTAALDLDIAVGGRPLLVAALVDRLREGSSRARTPLLLVTATGREAEDLAASLRDLLDDPGVVVFPSWETLPHERLSPRADTMGKRLAVLRRLVHPDPSDPAYGPLRVVCASVRAVQQPLVRGLADLVPVRLSAGDERALPDVVDDLVAAAYTRTDLVERRGEFAVRGGILDVFPPTSDHPLRVEFFGDEVEEVREFAVADQRSLEIVPSGLWAPPCRELLLTPAVRARAEELSHTLPGVADMLTKVSQGIAVEGMESLAPALVDGMEPLLDVLPDGSPVVVVDPERVRRRAHDLVETSAEFLEVSWTAAAGGGKVPIDLPSTLGMASYWTLGDIRSHALRHGRPWWSLTSFATDEELADDESVTVRVESSDTPGFRGDAEAAAAAVADWTRAGYAVVVATEGPGFARRVVEQLASYDVPATLAATPGEPVTPGTVVVAPGALSRGVVIPQVQLVLLSEADLTGAASSGGSSTKDMRRMPSRRRNVVDPLQLRPGDHVVHEQHGVGRFVELVQRQSQGGTREYLVIEYASSRRGQPGDRLYVPTDQLDQVTRYVGGESPTLNKMGGSDWHRTKSSARRHVREIAGELIRLYSARMATTGHAFGPDTPWQTELEDSFAYIETPDQLSTIDEVKADMAKPVPMDRLVCGDVGYGKTEIAVRAAFKAIQDGKQAAILVPTTLLVQQHYQTFSERYAPFPVKVAALSRFQSDKESKQILDGLATGTVDLVVGTHRLLSQEVTFKDLGLVVIDEEQRFGVEHKEKLKALRTNVDVLAMSATPIPRTLEMAVTGIREMSTLATPPEERHPVLTFVGGYDERQVVAAVRRELMREGQVFYVHNRVSSIERTAARLRELIPEARVATAHGQMPEHRLEQVVMDFWERRADVLVCTTIVETGLDISNANTLIVERADLLGLSQLHQLRGRVGRGRERAYAYFLYPPERPLTETAHDRLTTIATHSELGAGMHVAMKDLEIRGAGNLLGGEQSGHIAGVGFDLYVRLVGEAVAEFRGDGSADTPTEIRIDLPVTAHIPHEYLAEERLRLEAYRKLATVEDEAGLQAIASELDDRYGTLPDPVSNLVEVARLRTIARQAGIREITMQGPSVRFAPVELRESQELRLRRVYPGSMVKAEQGVILVPAPRTARVGGQPLRDIAAIQWAENLIRHILLDDIAAGASAARASRT